MTYRFLPWGAGLVMIVLAACSGGGGGSSDAGRGDTGGSDAGASDAGASDAARDAGTTPDASAADGAASDASPPGDAGPLTPRIEIGGGTEAFEPLGAGSTVELVHGPQGGYHVQIAFRLWGIDPEGLLIQAHGYDAMTGDEITIPAERILTARRVSPEGDHLLRLGDRLIFTATDPTTIYDPATSTGTELRISATFTPATGDPVMAETTTTVLDVTP